MPFVVAGAGALLGGIAGGSSKTQTQNTVSGVNLTPDSALQKQSTQTLSDQLAALTNLTNAGPGQQAVTNSLSATNSLAEMLKSFSQSGGVPTAGNVASANQYANSIFAPQFQQQNQQNAQLEASLGRSTNDPILQAKLATQQANTQGSFAAQYAQQIPINQLNFAQQLAGVQGNLASQAFSNRQALAQMGSGILQNQQNYQLATSQHYGNETQTSGGGIAGAIGGALGGAGAFLGVGQQLGLGGSSAGGGASALGQSPQLGSQFSAQPSYSLGAFGSPAPSNFASYGSSSGGTFGGFGAGGGSGTPSYLSNTPPFLQNNSIYGNRP